MVFKFCPNYIYINTQLKMKLTKKENIIKILLFTFLLFVTLSIIITIPIITGIGFFALRIHFNNLHIGYISPKNILLNSYVVSFVLSYVIFSYMQKILNPILDYMNSIKLNNPKNNFIKGYDNGLNYAYKWFKDYKETKFYDEIINDFKIHIDKKK